MRLNSLILGLIISNLFFLSTATAQLYEVSLDSKIDNPQKIIEGTVLSKESFYHNNDIWTANTIQPIKVLKGRQELIQNIVVLTRGGDMDSIYQYWHHFLELHVGDSGIFFLKSSEIPFKNQEIFRTYSSSQGFLKFSRTSTQNLIATAPFKNYTKINTELYEYIGRKVHGVDYQLEHDEKRTGVRYVFKNFDISNQSVTFDIFISGLYQEYKLFGSGIQIEYNEFFGNNVATNQLMQLQASDVASSSSYNLGISDVSSNVAQIQLSTVGNVANLNSIDPTEKPFAKGAFQISDLLITPTIDINVLNTLGLNRYYDNLTNQHYPFDTVIVEYDFGKFSCVPFIL